MSGAEKIFFTSAVTREGLNKLSEYIDEKWKEFTGGG
jgi:ethanolamine utilization protein EutP (predicted NTPase)